MLILHTSDTHGYFPSIPTEAEVIVHSGDLCPNASRGNREIEIPFQLEWLRKNLLTFKDWIGERPFIFCRGNHDFYPDICKVLQEANINAIDVTSKKVMIDGITFYGFPFIPYIDGEWNGECTSNEMRREINNLKNVLETSIDVLVCHCPPYGIADASFLIRGGIENSTAEVVPDWAEHYGNTHLANLFSYGLDEMYFPKYLLCGHVHTNPCITEYFGITISQAATKTHLVEIRL